MLPVFFPWMLKKKAVTVYRIYKTRFQAECNRNDGLLPAHCFNVLHYYAYFPFFFLLWRCDPSRVMASSFLRFSRSQTTTLHSRQDSSGRVISSSQRPLPDNTNAHNKHPCPGGGGFEPTISAGERPQTYALDRTANGTDYAYYVTINILLVHVQTCAGNIYVTVKRNEVFGLLIYLLDTIGDEVCVLDYVVCSVRVFLGFCFI